MKTYNKIILIPLAATIALTPHAALAKGETKNRSMESVHQPVVTHESYAYDVQVGSDGRLTSTEGQRLNGWLRSISLGYGDHVALGTDAYGPAVNDQIGALLAEYGLLLDAKPLVVSGAANNGFLRVTVRRAVASVPGCPDWSTKQENYGTALSSNFGCGVNSNLAAMMANPEDLVRGQIADSDLRTATSTRAIMTYQKKEPTGSGDLKTMSPGGK